MNASKEQVEKAIQRLEFVRSKITGDLGQVSKAIDEVKDVLDACFRKLPSEASYERDRQRRRKAS